MQYKSLIFSRQSKNKKILIEITTYIILLDKIIWFNIAIFVTITELR